MANLRRCDRVHGDALREGGASAGLEVTSLAAISASRSYGGCLLWLRSDSESLASFGRHSVTGFGIPGASDTRSYTSWYGEGLIHSALLCHFGQEGI
jgi:hypothetical protein